MKILGFDWDEINTAKVRGHELEPDDVEELFDDRPVIIRHPTRKDRMLAIGHVPDGRFCVVPFEYDEETRWVRVVTAYEADHEKWWKIYARIEGGRRR